MRRNGSPRAFIALFAASSSCACNALVSLDGLDDEHGGPSPSVDCGAELAAGAVLCDDFEGDELDRERWWYGRTRLGPTALGNGGVVPENVSVHDGRLWLTANGDDYSGEVLGVRVEGGVVFQDQPGQRTGALVSSDAYLGSGRYEVRLKLPGLAGAASFFSTSHYQELYEGDPGYEDYVAAGHHVYGTDLRWVAPVHQVAIETPVAPEGESPTAASHASVRYRTAIGEQAAELSERVVASLTGDLAGEFHVLRYDWYSGGGEQRARAEFFVDDRLQWVSTVRVPSIAGRFRIGIWFPDWAGGAAGFETQTLEVDWVKVMPFNEPNDKVIAETYPDAGLTRCHTKVENDAALAECQLTGW